MFRFFILILLLLQISCGPSVSTTRMQVHPAKKKDCSLEFLQLDIATMNAEKEWTVIGYVALSERGVQDPLSEKYRKLVRPKACELGGEAVAIAMSATNRNAGMGGTTTSYMVLVPYEETKNESSQAF